MLLLEALKTVSGGTLDVTTAQERTYRSTTNLRVLSAGSPGEKNMPILMTEACLRDHDIMHIYLFLTPQDG